MALPGIRGGDQQDFPIPMRESITTLPFHAGGSVTLTAGEASDLVKVSELRRFENMLAIARGSHTGSNNATTVTDSNADFLDWGVEPGDTVINRTKTPNTSAEILSVTATTLETESQDWDASDVYVVDKTVSHQYARAIEIRRITIVSDEPIYIRFDGAPDSTDGYDVELTSDEAYLDEHIRIVSRVAVIGVDATDTPKVRWTAWGI